MNPRAIVLDLDGTLLNEKKQVTKRTIDVLYACKDKGIKIIFATARPPRITRFTEIDLAALGAIIYYNGALFHCNRTNQKIHFPIPSSIGKKLIYYCLSLDPESNISIEVEDIWHSNKALDYRELMHVEKNPTIISIDQLVAYDCTKILLTDFSYVEELTDKFKDKVTVIVTDEERLIQVMSPQASKEQAVAHLLGTYELSFADTICFGDDYNDLGLFQSCGHTVAMGNAVDSLKEIADEITASNDNEGVAAVLERYVIN